MCDEELHDPFTDQVECARYRAERDALAQRMEEIASEIDRTLSGVEGIEDAPAMRWMRGLREALGALHAPRIGYEDIEAARWVRGHGGLAEVERKVAESIEQADDYIALRCSLAERAGDLYEMLDKEDDELIAILDERLMPEGMSWPRFEDGEPVRVGDEYECWCEETHIVNSVTIREGRSVLNESQPHSFVVSDGPFTAHGKRVKRPAPKVLDADGAEIHEGDTVWPAFPDPDPRNQVERAEVVGIHAEVERVDVRAVYATGMSFREQVNADQLTHRAPVIAADGKPLREGERVWHVKTGREYVVVEPSYGKTVVVRLAKYDDAEGEQHAPDQLTHERPDSWERLEADADGIVHDIAWNIGDYSPSDFKVPGDSLQDRVVDLVRRAKALAERGQ